MSRLPGIAALAGVGFAVSGACRTPTSITFAFRTDVDCAATQPPPIAFASVGVPAQVSKPDAFKEPTSTKDCDVRASGTALGELGTLVALPKDDEEAEVGMVVVLGVTRPTVNCGAPDADHAEPWAGCIIARRRLGFLDGEALDVDVPLYLDCVGIPCDELSTCVPQRGCVSSTVDPNDCLEKSCGDDDLQQTGASTGAGPSASSSDASSGDASSSGSGGAASSTSSSSTTSSGGDGGDGGTPVTSGGGEGGSGSGGDGGLSEGGGGSGEGGAGGDGTGGDGTGASGSGGDGGGGGTITATTTTGGEGGGGVPTTASVTTTTAGNGVGGAGDGGGGLPLCGGQNDCVRCSQDGLSLEMPTCLDGTCRSPVASFSCEPYVCGTDACLDSCSGNQDCQGGAVCVFGGSGGNGSGGNGACQ